VPDKALIVQEYQRFLELLPRSTSGRAVAGKAKAAPQAAETEAVVGREAYAVLVSVSSAVWRGAAAPPVVEQRRPD
jgi:hypothetical protein